ncbi:hypothetical protein V8D89_007048 [Ganoderma adspersum]
MSSALCNDALSARSSSGRSSVFRRRDGRPLPVTAARDPLPSPCAFHHGRATSLVRRVVRVERGLMHDIVHMHVDDNNNNNSVERHPYEVRRLACAIPPLTTMWDLRRSISSGLRTPAQYRSLVAALSSTRGFRQCTTHLGCLPAHVDVVFGLSLTLSSCSRYSSSRDLTALNTSFPQENTDRHCVQIVTRNQYQISTRLFEPTCQLRRRFCIQ